MLYFDNAATTRADDDILEIYTKYNTELYYNPSSLHKYALAVGKDIANARSLIGEILGCSANEILFTSGGTESDNTAIFGGLHTNKGRIVTDAVEHSAVDKCMKKLKNQGYDVAYCDVLPCGAVDLESFAKTMTADTIMVCIMHVNNETGVINDIKNLVKIAKTINPKVIFVCDGIQAVGKIAVNVKDLGVDCYAFSGHKFHSPKGIGGLYIKNGVKINAFHLGGGQENGLRSGTENVGGIIAMAFAMQKAVKNMQKNSEIYAKFRAFLRQKFDELGDYVCVSELCYEGEQQNIANKIQQNIQISPCILNVAFAQIKSQVLSNMLEQEDIIIGLGSACSSKSTQSRVMAGIGLDKRYVEGVVRISFSKYNTMEEVEILADKMQKNIALLRKLTIK